MTDLRVHVMRTGRLVGNQTFLRGEGWSSLLHRPSGCEFPAYSLVLELSDGLIAIDTGMSAGVRSPRPRFQRRVVPNPFLEVEIGPAMRARGLDPAAVRQVVLTHLDWDHAGGVARFPDAEVLVHRPEREFASTLRVVSGGVGSTRALTATRTAGVRRAARRARRCRASDSSA